MKTVIRELENKVYDFFFSQDEEDVADISGAFEILSKDENVELLYKDEIIDLVEKALERREGRDIFDEELDIINDEVDSIKKTNSKKWLKITPFLDEKDISYIKSFKNGFLADSDKIAILLDRAGIKGKWHGGYGAYTYRVPKYFYEALEKKEQPKGNIKKWLEIIPLLNKEDINYFVTNKLKFIILRECRLRKLLSLARIKGHYAKEFQVYTYTPPKEFLEELKQGGKNGNTN